MNASDVTTQDTVVVINGDNHEGMGGSYEMRDGKRVLVHRTAEAAPAKPAEGGPGPVAELKAAAVGVALAPPEVSAKVGRAAKDAAGS